MMSTIVCWPFSGSQFVSPSRRRRRTSRPGTSPGTSRRSRGSSSAQCSVQWQWDRSGGRNYVEVGSAEGGAFRTATAVSCQSSSQWRGGFEWSGGQGSRRAACRVRTVLT